MRQKIYSKKPEIEHCYVMQSSIPDELIHADNGDFVTEDINTREYIKSIVKETLAEDNLKVNDDKTEETELVRHKTKGEEEWRNVKKLGSLLGCYKNMRRRI